MDNTQRLPVHVPTGYDPQNPTHLTTILKKLEPSHGTGWETETYDPTSHTLHLIRRPTITQITTSPNQDIIMLSLERGTRPTDADRLQAKYEDRYPGYYLTAFDPYLGAMTLTRLDTNTHRAQLALAHALKVKPWNLTITPNNGGYQVQLPTTYQHTLDYKKLQDTVRTTIGKPGWVVEVDPKALTAQIIPATLPTFPQTIPYPTNQNLTNPWSIPIGQALPQTGNQPPTPINLDFDATPGCLATGTAGAGKSVFVNSLITGALLRGWELAVGVVPHKALDFLWVKPYVRAGGWGCDSLEATCAMLQLVYREKDRRSQLLEQYGAHKIQDLPTQIQPRPILVVLDELTALFALTPIPRGIPKTEPIVIEAQQRNLITQTIISTTEKIPAELRFVGIRLLASTQMAQANTGVSVPFKTNLANRVILGANPNRQQRGHALLNPASAPEVPDWIRYDKAASRGVGVAELEGQTPTVFKGYYADTPQFLGLITQTGLPQNPHPAPTTRDIAELVPLLSEE